MNSCPSSFKRNPFWPVKEMEAEMMEGYGVSVNVW